MKKIGIVLVAAVILAVSGYSYVSRVSDDLLEFAEYLPQDTLAAFSITNLNDLIDSFGSSPLGRFLAKENCNGIMRMLQVDPAVRDQYDAAYDNVVSLLTNPAFQTVFGRDATLAVLSLEVAAMWQTPVLELQRSTVLLARSIAPGALEGFVRLMSKSASAETVEGVELTKVILEDGQVLYGVSESDMVLLSYDPSVLIRCLAVHNGGVSLRDSDAFGQAQNYWNEVPEEQVYSRLFLHGDNLRQTFSEAADEDMQVYLADTDGITAIAGVVFHAGELLQVDTMAFFQPDRLPQALRDMIAGQADTNTTLELIHENCLAYEWSSALIPEGARHYLQNAPGGQLLDLEKALTESLGVPMEDILEGFGPQYGFVVNEIVKGGFFPVPKVLMFFEIRDRVAAARVVDMAREVITNTGYTREQKRQYAGTTLYYWSFFPGEATTVVLVMTDTMVYMANGFSTLQTVLDQQGQHVGLNTVIASEMGETMSAQVDQARLGLHLLYPRRMAIEMRDIMQWLVDMAPVSKGTTLSQMSDEFIRLMESVEVTAGTSSLTPDYATWNWTLKFAGQGESGNSTP